MRASFAGARAGRRITSVLSHSSSSSPLTVRTISSTSRRCTDTREDGQPLRFSDFQNKAPAEEPVEQADTLNDAASQEKPVFTQDASRTFITYTPKGAATGYQIERQRHLIKVTDLETGMIRNFYAHSLRDACTCSACRDKSSGNKNFSQAQIPLDIAITYTRPQETGLVLRFLDDSKLEHRMFLSWDRLETAMKDEPPMMGMRIKDQLVEKTGIVNWDRNTISARVRTIDYHKFVKGTHAMWDVIMDLSRYGLVFLNNVPEEEDSIVKITTTIANIKETFYGRTFDVRAKPKAENVAYTSGYLGLHQDLLYLDSPPQIQILHCLENSCSGGESLFADGDRVGRAILAATSGRDVTRHRHALSMEIPYRYDKNRHYYMQQRPFMQTIKTGSAPNGDGKIFDTMWWSPPFAAPEFHDKHFHNREALFSAAKIFEETIHAEENMFERKMKPGECVLFDNRRVMHGRRAFDAQGGGSRWLRGAYISEEDFFSRASYLPERYTAFTRGDAVRSRAEADKEVAGTPLVKEMREHFIQAHRLSSSAQAARKTKMERLEHNRATTARQTSDELVPAGLIKDDPEAVTRGAQRLQRLRSGKATAKDGLKGEDKVESANEEKVEGTAAEGQS